ncbi:nuclear transport factor 2 family protein [Lacibacter sediminis]|uniref:Nuclear transport factor 2 family protein n=1 Tax=Lacibacter sediminis TaxID=2760713 RepID=A0A7G5XDG2_9BACT|nr:nuclear transport factor 2 family protein [Lacibacter sediminis]QNA43515.1 nuclear transport factor 2 family protein [Lacibacter sediminis]
MKLTTLFLLAVFLFFFFIDSFSQQQGDEALIRKLEDKEREAILKSDTALLHELMSQKIVVQNPENEILGFQQIMDRIKKGKINYASFERRIDNIAFINGIAVVMGLETLVPKADTQHAGKAVTRRFTNIWTTENGKWKLTARQATIISIN